MYVVLLGTVCLHSATAASNTKYVPTLHGIYIYLHMHFTALQGINIIMYLHNIYFTALYGIYMYLHNMYFCATGSCILDYDSNVIHFVTLLCLVSTIIFLTLDV